MTRGPWVEVRPGNSVQTAVWACPVPPLPSPHPSAQRRDTAHAGTAHGQADMAWQGAGCRPRGKGPGGTGSSSDHRRPSHPRTPRSLHTAVSAQRSHWTLPLSSTTERLIPTTAHVTKSVHGPPLPHPGRLGSRSHCGSNERENTKNRNVSPRSPSAVQYVKYSENTTDGTT